MNAKRFLSATVLCLLAALARADGPAKPALTIEDLAMFSEAVIIARVGQTAAAPEKHGGSVALWVEQLLKGGKLHAGRDIIWVPKNELPQAEVNSWWLLFLVQNGDGSWHVQNGGNEKNLIRLENRKAPVIAEVSKYVGSYGPPPLPEAPSVASADRSAA